MAEQFELPFLGEVPIVQGIREGGDMGMPAVLDEANPASRIFMELASIYAFVARFFREVFVPPYEFREIIRVVQESGIGEVTIEEGEMRVTVTLKEVSVGTEMTVEKRRELRRFEGSSVNPWTPFPVV